MCIQEVKVYDTNILQVAEGFIEDDDEEEAEEDREERRRRKKRAREERENEALLDEDDLDLIGLGQDDRTEEQSKFKRLKRGHRDDRQRAEARGVEEIFEDEEDVQEERRGLGRGLADEFDDFIEEDEFPDEEGDVRDDMEVARPARRGFVDPLKFGSGMDETAQEDMMAAFGDGTEYDWALQMQEEEDELEDGGGQYHPKYRHSRKIPDCAQGLQGARPHARRNGPALEERGILVVFTHAAKAPAAKRPDRAI